MYQPAPILSECSTVSKAWTHLRSVITGKAYTFFDYGSSRFAQAINQSITERSPDLIHMDSLDLHRYVQSLDGFRIACTHHNIESDLLQRRADHERNPILRSYMAAQAKAIRETERAMTPRLALNLMMSEVDAKRLHQIAPGALTALAPNGVDTDEVKPRQGVTATEGRVAFLGPSYMLPNRDGVEWFLRDVWPLVRSARPDAVFHVIGKVADNHKEVFEAAPGVHCTGFVEDLPAELASASCVVAPLRIGGGTRLKILDSWAMANPVVSTSIGCEGLLARDGINIVIRDQPEPFAKAVVSILGDAAKAAAIGLAGRETAVMNYSWKAIGATLGDDYRRLLNKPPA